MLLIPCPNCGPRIETEFVLGGPVRALRPEDASDIPADAWIDYLTVPDNPLGLLREKWWHAKGCGAWTVVVRDTRTHDLHPAGDTHG